VQEGVLLCLVAVGIGVSLTSSSASGLLLLVTQRVYSQHLVSYWAHKGYILSIWYPIGHTEGIFSASGILLGTQRVYSHPLIPHLSVPVTLWG
jgi:hypothetical protein